MFVSWKQLANENNFFMLPFVNAQSFMLFVSLNQFLIFVLRYGFRWNICFFFFCSDELFRI